MTPFLQTRVGAEPARYVDFSGLLLALWQVSRRHEFRRRTLRPGRRLCPKCGRDWLSRCHRRDRDRLINEGVRRRIRPRHNIADKTERQVCGTEQHWRHLWMLLRLRPGVCTEGKLSICRLLNTRHILSHSAERAHPTLVGTLPYQVYNGPASRAWQDGEQQGNIDCAKGHFAPPETGVTIATARNRARPK